MVEVEAQENGAAEFRLPRFCTTSSAVDPGAMLGAPYLQDLLNFLRTNGW